MKTVEDFIKKRLEVRGGKIRLKTYQSEILKILEAGLTVKEVHLYLTETYPALQKMNLSNLYEFVRKLKKMPEQNTGFKNPEVGQAKPEPKKTAEPIQPAKETEPVNLQDKFKVQGENSAEPIEKNTGAQIQRRSKSVLKPEKVDEWQEHRKKMGLPNTIDDEWRNKPTEEE